MPWDMPWDSASPNVIRAFLEDSLREALDKMNTIQVDELPVVKEQAPNDPDVLISAHFFYWLTLRFPVLNLYFGGRF
jgi:hypothetical protein